MATNYPGDIDDFTNPNGTDPVTAPDHAEQHSDANDAIEALQTKVGADSSAVNTTHDYKLNEVADGDKAVGKASTQTLTNKTLTSPVVNEVKPSAGSTLSLTDTTDTLVTRNTEETLTNKTLTSPKVNELTDVNGNETIDTPAATNAVNQVEVKNSATGSDVEVNATGDDTDINISVKGKGTGVVKIGSGDIEMPNTIGGSGQVLTSDGASAASWTDKADITGVPEIKASNYLLAQAQSTPDLTLQVALGNVYFGSTLVEFAGGNSPSFTAPSANPRIDILSINSSGTLVRTAGDEGATPTAPDVPVGETPIAQVYNRVGQTSIKDADDSTNGYIEKDLRPFLRISNELLNRATESDELQASSDAETHTNIYDTWVKAKEIRIDSDYADLRIKFDLKSGSLGWQVKGRLYKNGVAVGTERTTDQTTYQTFSEDIDGWENGDLIQVYYFGHGDPNISPYIRNFRIYCTKVAKSIKKINGTELTTASSFNLLTTITSDEPEFTVTLD